MNKISLIVKLGLLSAVIAVGFSGCSGKKIVANTPLKLNYNIKEKSKTKIGKTIIILNSKSEMDEVRANETRNRSNSNPLTKLIVKKIAQGMGEIEGCDFNSIYYKTYEKKFLHSFKNKLSDVIESKGFTTITDYQTLDDISYKNRKQSYLLIYPEINLLFSSNKSDSSQTGSKYTEKGQMSLSAVIKLNYIEPLSKEKLDTLKINLTDIGIENNYVCQQDFEKESGSTAFGMGFNIGTKIGEALFSNKEADTTRIVTSDALNKVFSLMMEEIEKKIHTEDFLAYSHDINEIKKKKRY